MNFSKTLIRMGAVISLGLAVNSAIFAQRSACYTVTVEVNDSQCATIVVPRGQIVIIDYDQKTKTLCLSDIKPIDLHPSPTYQKKGSIFFSAIRPGEFKLNWRSGECGSRIVVK